MATGPGSKRKSCAECVKAKRKCGMELPTCQRCSKKNIACSYPNNRFAVADTAFPELEFSWLDDLMRDSGLHPWTGQLQPQLDAASTGTYSGRTESDAPLTAATELDESTAAGGSSCTYTAHEEIEAALHRFKTWPEKWLREGRAPFIHPQLYASRMPRPLQDAYAACAIYSTKTKQNEFVAFTVIESKANELLHSTEQLRWSPLDLLAATQALLIFQFIRLFDGDIRQRAAAEKAEPILQTWTERLKSRTTEEQTHTTETAPSWRSWIFGESVRRTITMSLFLDGAYSLVKEGFCTLGRKITANSFTAQRRLWEAQSPLQWERARQNHDSYWVSKMDFDRVMRESGAEELDDFGMVLLITYKGQDVVDHWMATGQPQNPLGVDTNFHRSLLGVL
ncbi:hypothetical protein K458DRAFT_100106 [Lentithecium fluviatile CBS 122367]|uniref:Zn(2)-C6 fungal-type domain-containing protein n=1 Tax=Lentithecium fluviatile CBS 122367 TaxID=1168545 RepID=A0A6G1JJ75_9PLEO|nr:hypothetical protein K458DRAFT_100106 [Lentithecium fluviatile CBS 122367]